MRAKQGAVVSKFLTFFQQKNTLVIELYAKCFYNQKPQSDRIAEFVSESLCYRPELRDKIKDVQFHPLKMLVFVRYTQEEFRDEVVEKINSKEGIKMGALWC